MQSVHGDSATHITAKCKERESREYICHRKSMSTAIQQTSPRAATGQSNLLLRATTSILSWVGALEPLTPGPIVRPSPECNSIPLKTPLENASQTAGVTTSPCPSSIKDGTPERTMLTISSGKASPKLKSSTTEGTASTEHSVILHLVDQVALHEWDLHI